FVWFETVLAVDVQPEGAGPLIVPLIDRGKSPSALGVCGFTKGETGILDDCLQRGDHLARRLEAGGQPNRGSGGYHTGNLDNQLRSRLLAGVSGIPRLAKLIEESNPLKDDFFACL